MNIRALTDAILAQISTAERTRDAARESGDLAIAAYYSGKIAGLTAAVTTIETWYYTPEKDG